MVNDLIPGEHEFQFTKMYEVTFKTNPLSSREYRMEVNSPKVAECIFLRIKSATFVQVV